jgi:16S rRNA (uracil1498-N3)-methyltransferase
MKHLSLPFRCDDKKEITLAGPDTHYLTHVLRLKKGSSFKGLDTAGKRYTLTVKEIKNKTILLSVGKCEQLCPELPPIVLFQALPKGSVMDRIIRQATETGISRIIPVITDYTIVQPKTIQSIENKLERWCRIIKGAVQQSEGVLVPHVSSPVSLKDAITLTRGVKLFFHNDKKGNRTLHESLNKDKIEEINIFIGPEGGFSKSEYNLLKENEFIPINLGNTVLRVDTAAVCALAGVKIILIEKEKWRNM